MKNKEHNDRLWLTLSFLTVFIAAAGTVAGYICLLSIIYGGT